MSGTSHDFWTDNTSVIITSLWGWTPETWGTIGWTTESRRNNLLKQLSDPFVAVCSVTKTSESPSTPPELKGMIAGFYLVSHEIGDRDDFTDSKHHDLEPKRWRHSLRALKAFSYKEPFEVSEYDPEALERALSIASKGERVTDPARVALLRDRPAEEVEVYNQQPQ